MSCSRMLIVAPLLALLLWPLHRMLNTDHLLLSLTFLLVWLLCEGDSILSECVASWGALNENEKKEKKMEGKKKE